MRKNEKQIIVQTTHRRQKIITTREMIDPITGEVTPVIYSKIEDRDFNFHKVWLEHFISALDEITNKKLKLAFWIIKNLDYENKLVMTQRAIAEKSGMSYKTVTDTMKALQNGNPPFLQKINSGAYKVNPDILWKGKHSNRMGVIFEYDKETTDDEKNDQK